MTSAPPSEAPSTDPLPAPEPARHSLRCGRIAVVLAAVLVALIVCGWIPGVVGTIGAVLLPWLAIPLVLALVVAVWTARRSIAVLLVPMLLWVTAMVPALPGFDSTAQGDPMVVVAQNVKAESGTAADSARAAVDEGAGVIALTELDADSRAAAQSVLDADYPYRYEVGTEGIWSRYPLGAGEPLSLGLGWKRAARVTVQAPAGDVSLYLVHAASVRLGEQEGRDEMLSQVADVVAADRSERVLVVGDFNAASTDPALATAACCRGLGASHRHLAGIHLAREYSRRPDRPRLRPGPRHHLLDLVPRGEQRPSRDENGARRRGVRH